MAGRLARAAYQAAGSLAAAPLLESVEALSIQASLTERVERCCSGASASTSSISASHFRQSAQRYASMSSPLALFSQHLDSRALHAAASGATLTSPSRLAATRGLATATAAPATATLQAAPTAPASSGGVTPAELPWPWVDPRRPRLMPVAVVRERKADVPLQAALQQLLEPLRPGQRAVHSLEAQVRFALDPRRSDHLVRGSVVLPYGTGKQIRLVVFAKGLEAEIAREMGVDLIGDEELIASIINSNGAAINFDKLIATPDFMRPLARAGKVLGPKGLMPNPKLGTLTSDVATAINEIRRGRLDYRLGRDATIRAALGRASMPADHLAAHVGGLVASLMDNKPKVLGGGPAGRQKAAGAAMPATGAGSGAAVGAGGADAPTVAMLEGYIMRFLLKSSYSAPVRISLDSLVEAVGEYRKLVGSGAGAAAGDGSGDPSSGTSAAEGAASTPPKAA